MALETYRTWARLFELERYYSWIVDCFHISTQAYQLRAHEKRHDFGWLEDRLRPLGFRLVFCTRAPDSLAAARAERLEVSGNPRQCDDLSLFVAEQELLRELVAASTPPTLEVDVSGSDAVGASDREAEWLEATGGLYAPR
jgi:hypothetical protein